jgi:hypothetical protein
MARGGRFSEKYCAIKGKMPAVCAAVVGGVEEY